MMNAERTLPWDWYSGIIPENVTLDDTAYIETTYSFTMYRSESPVGMSVGLGSSVYLSTMFDVGRPGQIIIGDYVMLNGARIICDSKIEIGDYTFISWNVLIMDSYRLPFDPAQRRSSIEKAFTRNPPAFIEPGLSHPISIGSNVWVGFDACILPGVTIGEGSIIGARSVVAHDVPPYTIVAGNPAQVIRHISH
jgi:acetyltransferase-like isoleucine patch superfamily enzyme